ncbi:hypothetical protein GCM10017673_38700 [Streptosporangium violaceochromogenes]|nr:hypothetical protein GCM10017673_38700 [Streptosporangium violaceochromogenes]
MFFVFKAVATRGRRRSNRKGNALKRFVLGLLTVLAVLVAASTLGSPSPAVAAAPKGVVVSPAEGAVLTAGDAVVVEATATGVCAPELLVSAPGGEPVRIAVGSGGALCTGMVTLSGTWTPGKAGVHTITVAEGTLAMASRAVGVVSAASPAPTVTATATVTATPQESQTPQAAASPAPTVTVTATPKPSKTPTPAPKAAAKKTPTTGAAPDAARPVPVVVTVPPAQPAVQPAPVAAPPLPPVAAPDVSRQEEREPVVLPAATVTAPAPADPGMAFRTVPVAAGEGLGIGSVVLTALLTVVVMGALGFCVWLLVARRNRSRTRRSES